MTRSFARFPTTVAVALALGAALLLNACGDDGGGGGDAGPTDGGGSDDGGTVAYNAPACSGLDAYDPPDPMCEPEPTDYSPGADDMWPECISDDGEYHRIMETISSIARVAAFEEIEDDIGLFDPSRDPSPDEFLMARSLYQEEEGLDSRVARRFDPHYSCAESDDTDSCAPDGTDCTVSGTPDEFPGYCVGPAKLQPTILDEFQAAIEDTSSEPRRMHAARIEAALLWFFYASQYKESFTCTTKAKDCDSSYAYYTGGEEARGGIGLAADLQETDPEAHDRAWDGLLGVRCWRDLDDGDVAMDLEKRQWARSQYDRAVLDGVAEILRERLMTMCGASGPELGYHWAFFQTLAPVLLREMEEQDSAQAEALRTEIERDAPEDIDVLAAIEAIDAVFQCP